MTKQYFGLLKIENEFTKIKIIPIGLENRWRIKNGRLKQFNKYKNISNNKNLSFYQASQQKQIPTNRT